MPPPIVPAPTTAAWRIGMRGVSLAMPGTLATSRSAKKTWMSAFDWSEKRHSRKSSRLALAALGERQRDGGLDRVDGLERGDQAAGLLLHLLADRGEDRRVGRGGAELRR